MLPYLTAPTRLGSGTYAKVDKFTNASWGHFTIKTALKGATDQDVDKEARRLAMFSHPNVIRYFGRLEYLGGGRPKGIITEWMQTDLHEFMKK